MSLLKAIEDTACAVAFAEENVETLKGVLKGLEAILGEHERWDEDIPDEQEREEYVPWYLNIPANGVECWVEDSEKRVRAERDEDCKVTSIVNSYDSSQAMRFDTDCYRWRYAIPVDPKLRLPNGAITL